MKQQKLRRTLLWTKGHHPREVEAALASNADAIVFECEDMVIAPEKEAALQGAVHAMMTMDFRGKEKIIRPNALDTDRGQRDLEAILPCKPDAIRLPKCEHVADLLALDDRLSKYEAEQGWEHNSIELILTLETPLGVLNAYELASCCERITGMGLGAGDLTSAMGVDRDLTPGSVQLLYAKQKMVMDGKAAGVQLFDTTVICFGDELDDFIAQDTAFIKNLGFTGRSVSMLRHIDIINRVFAPSAEEVALARKIVEGYAAGVAAGVTEVFVDGHFVDPPVVSKEEMVVELDRMIRERAAQ
ncbi:MAG: hypothetical protein GX592_07410 [Clostridiales bacterium]|nr:hypothetical protein [Clostridiales bacterium]